MQMKLHEISHTVEHHEHSDFKDANDFKNSGLETLNYNISNCHILDKH